MNLNRLGPAKGGEQKNWKALLLRECLFRFMAAIAEKLLPVEIALLDVVEIGDYEFADARAGKGYCHV